MVIMMKNLSKNNNLLLLDILHKFIFSKKCGASITDVDANKLELLCRDYNNLTLSGKFIFIISKRIGIYQKNHCMAINQGKIKN